MNQLVQYDEPQDGFMSVPQSGNSAIRGSILKFSSGEYSTSSAVMNGRTLVVAGAWTGWIRWEDGKPTETKVTIDRRR